MAKGVVLAGGTGSRLSPCTQVTNKHLLPVGPYPMIFHPLNLLKAMHIEDIMIVVGGDSVGDFLKLMGSGRKYGLNLSFRVQDEANGIAGAILLAEDFVDKEDFVVVLGDNVFDPQEFNSASLLKSTNYQYYGRPIRDKGKYLSKLFLKKVSDPERFGVATLCDNGRIVKIVEKPQQPETDLAVTGLYMYSKNSNVFDVIRNLKISDRGEFEITDVNNYYVDRGYCISQVVDGFWSDAGTWDSYQRANEWAFVNKIDF